MRRTLRLTAAIALSLTSLVASSSNASATVGDPLYTIVDFNQTSVSWIADPQTTKYDVYVNGALVRTVQGSTSIHVTIGRLLGPADKVEIASTATPTVKTTATYWSYRYVYFPSYVVRFAVKSTSLNADAKAKIAAFAALAKKHGFTNVRAFGHDAGRYAAPGAWDLGMRRSNVVLAALTKALPGADLKTEALSQGNSFPVASNATAAGMAANRRVELTMM